ncbi:MAG: response regulator transcription factor [Bryobacteraceae bacterium]|jgi:two-component system KDP operon response regulator KdpE
MGQRVLVVENEEIVAFDLEVCLATLGYSVTVATTGEGAMAMASRLRPDVVLMDIHLDGSVDGIVAAEWIRKETGIPLIFVTAYSSPDTLDRAVAVDPAGYIVKPFNERSLAANICLALHRGRHPLEAPDQAAASLEAGPSEVLVTKIGNLRIDGFRHRVFRGESEIELTKKEFRILQCLAEHAGVPISPEALLTKAWGPQFVHYIQALRVHMGHLRHKIEGNPSAGVLIETVRGVGYRLVEVAQEY